MAPDYFSSCNNMPWLRSTNRLRGQIAPELMLFLPWIFGQLFRLSSLFQIRQVWICRHSNENVCKHE